MKALNVYIGRCGIRREAKQRYFMRRARTLTSQLLAQQDKHSDERAQTENRR